jgi:dolichyl-phosphate-mannose--protein O-mannosyl transferase
MGALLIPLIWWIGFGLTRNRRAAAIAMLAALMSGLILVESRSAMINIPFVFYAMAALAATLVGLRRARCWPLTVLLLNLDGRCNRSFDVRESYGSLL